MALVLADRVRDTTTTAGTGTVTLSGTAPTGYQTFGAAIGNANTTYYTIAGQGTTEWEVGIGTYTAAGVTLSRDTVLASSNAGALVPFSAGTKDVFVTYPAEKSVNQDASGNVGIGTSSPNAKVDVQTTGAYSAYFQTAVDQASNVAARRISLTAINYRATIQGQSFSGTWGADDLLINPSGGNVGIGYSAPKTRLQVTAGVNLNAPSLGSATNAPFYVTNTDTAYGLLAGTNASDGHVWLQAQRTDGTATAYNLTLNEAGGNVGIGTSSPAGPLSVVSTANGEVIRAQKAGGTNLTLLRVNMNDTANTGTIEVTGAAGNPALCLATVGVERVRINDAGNVGIGTSSPQVRAHISTVDQSTNRLRLQNTGTGGGNFDIVGGNPGTSNAGLGFYDVTNAATRMYIDSAGNVGVGNNNPGYRLDVASADTTAGLGYAMRIRANATAAGGALQFTDSGVTAQWGFLAATSTAVTLDCSSAGSVVFRTNGSERVRIDSSGNVGIGTSSPSNLLEVRKDQDADTIVKVINAASAPNATARYDLATYTANSYMILALKDNVASPYGQLSTGSAVTGIYYDCAQHVFRSQSGTTWFSILGSSGTLTSLPTYNNTATGSTVVVTSAGLIRRTSSSIKYKKDVENLDPAIATNAIDNLRPVWYRTKNAEGDDKATWSHIGLIAEEVDKVEPRLVRYRTDEVIDEQKPVLDEAGEPVLDEDGNETFTIEQVVRELAVPEPEDVDYARLSVLLLAEVKSLRERIAALEAK